MKVSVAVIEGEDYIKVSDAIAILSETRDIFIEHGYTEENDLFELLIGHFKLIYTWRT